MYWLNHQYLPGIASEQPQANICATVVEPEPEKRLKRYREKDDLGSWLDNAGRYPTLSPSEIHSIASRIQSLPEDSPKRGKLVNKLVTHNLRLVAFSVKSYMAGAHSGRKWGCPETVDFLQVGAMGLLRAAELYDPEKGYSFSTYANHWIRSKVTRHSIKTRSLVHVSESMARSVISYNRNGFLKCRKTGGKIDDAVALPMVREAEAALRCASLNAANEDGYELIGSIEDRSTGGEDHDLGAAVDSALDAAGVSDIGRRILMLTLGHGYSQTDAAKELGLTINILRRQSLLAQYQAKQSKELARLV